MTFVELPVVPIYWHFPRTIKGYTIVKKLKSPWVHVALFVGKTLLFLFPLRLITYQE